MKNARSTFIWFKTLPYTNVSLTFASLHKTWMISLTLWFVKVGLGHFADFCLKNTPGLVFTLKLSTHNINNSNQNGVVITGNKIAMTIYPLKIDD